MARSAVLLLAVVGACLLTGSARADEGTTTLTLEHCFGTQRVCRERGKVVVGKKGTAKVEGQATLTAEDLRSIRDGRWYSVRLGSLVSSVPHASIPQEAHAVRDLLTISFGQHGQPVGLAYSVLGTAATTRGASSSVSLETKAVLSLPVEGMKPQPYQKSATNAGTPGAKKEEAKPQKSLLARYWWVGLLVLGVIVGKNMLGV